MYRFGGAAAVATAATPPAAGEPRITIRAAPTSFERAAAGDRILTVDGDQLAYIAGSRWVVAASILFDDAVVRAFEAQSGPARLLARDEPVPADCVLKLDVQTFEVRYDHGRGGAPTIVVHVYAALAGRMGAPATSQLFQVEEPAGSDTVRAIAAAFDAAVGKALGETVAWTQAAAVSESKAAAEGKSVR
jgi:cholesterol transport system auxiliary component